MTDRWRITLTFEDWAVYSYVLDPADERDDCRAGTWKRPFPNKPGDSFAYGVVEAAEQSAFVKPMLDVHGEVVRVQIEDMRTVQAPPFHQLSRAIVRLSGHDVESLRTLLDYLQWLEETLQATREFRQVRLDHYRDALREAEIERDNARRLAEVYRPDDHSLPWEAPTRDQNAGKPD